MTAILDAIVAIIVGIPVTLVATVTNNEVALCDRMGGTYQSAPAPTDVCPGGHWSSLVRRKDHP